MALSSQLQLLLALAAGAALGWQWRRRREQPRSHRPPPEAPLDLPAEQLRRWVDDMPLGWLVIAPDKTIASLNPRAEKLLEVDQGLALLGQPISVLAPSDEVLHLIELARDKGVTQRGSWPLAGDTLDLRMLAGSGGWVGLLLQGRSPLQAQLEQQEQWVGDVAHELKTPITALMLVGDSLAARAEGQQAVLVARLQRELQRLQLLVSDLLDLSRLENTPLAEGRPAAAVDPRDVIGSVWATLEPLARDRGIHLAVNPARDAVLLAAADPARLHQALLNLLDNALRYSPDQEVIEVTISRRDRWCQISVRDHGPGLSSTDQKRLFQRFYRGDPARAKGPRTGSGLGLSIVQQIALSQGGMVRATNHPQGGAVLELLLPMG
ncbi:MAG: sensor histidine kinase [Synechococcaceae bacterium WB8_1B_136]|nr:sensor histidine kinase [Synechococcaceae bacterium WB8_1B_136]